MISDKHFTLLHLAVFLLFTFIITIATFQVAPYGDDLHYLTAPRALGIPLESLLPESGRWRPLDGLLGMLLSEYSVIFPALNQTIVLVGHIGSSLLLVKIAILFDVRRNVAWVGGLIFLVGGNTFATFSSIDSPNQSLSLFFGLCGVTAYINKRYIWYILFGLLAVSAKESGFLFFLIPPALKVAGDAAGQRFLCLPFIRNAIPHLLFGVLLSVLYFVFTYSNDIFGWGDSIAAGAGKERKAIYDMPLLGAAILSLRFFNINLPAFLLPDHKAYVLGGIIALTNIPMLLCMAFYTLKNCLRNLYVIVLIGIICVISLAHAMVGALTEMNSYPVIFFMTLLAAFCLELCARRYGEQRALLAVALPFLIGSILMVAHKFTLIYETNAMAREFAQRVDAQITRRPQMIAVIMVDNGHFGHDIYQLHPHIAASQGKFMQYVWNDWSAQFTFESVVATIPRREAVQYGEIIVVDKQTVADESLLRRFIADRVEANLASADQVWLIFGDGEVIISEASR